MRIAASALILTLAGCGGGGNPTPDAGTETCVLDNRGETYQPGMQQAGMNKLFTVKLLDSNPGPPVKGTNTWMIAVADAGGAPVPGATITVVPFMPDHGHGSPIKVAVTDQGGGQYQLAPLYLFMAGIWQITINITANNMTDQSVFYFCIEG